MSSTPSLSIVVPFYNEGAMVDSTVAALARDDAEFIFVDDGSSDETGARLMEAARQSPNIRVIVHEQNRGANAALLTGLYAATGESIIVLDADLSYGPEHVDVRVHNTRQSPSRRLTTSTGRCTTSRRRVSPSASRPIASFEASRART
jgi:glycosyltransferase involved in cell wall biosynthesis